MSRRAAEDSEYLGLDIHAGSRKPVVCVCVYFIKSSTKLVLEGEHLRLSKPVHGGSIRVSTVVPVESFTYLVSDQARLCG